MVDGVNAQIGQSLLELFSVIPDSYTVIDFALDSGGAMVTLGDAGGTMERILHSLQPFDIGVSDLIEAIKSLP